MGIHRPTAPLFPMSFLPWRSPRRCLAHILARSYPHRTDIRFSRFKHGESAKPLTIQLLHDNEKTKLRLEKRSPIPYSNIWGRKGNSTNCKISVNDFVAWEWALHNLYLDKNAEKRTLTRQFFSYPYTVTRKVRNGTSIEIFFLNLPPQLSKAKTEL